MDNQKEILPGNVNKNLELVPFRLGWFEMMYIN